MSTINWNELIKNEYVKFEDGKQKTLLLKNWRQSTSVYEDEEKKCLSFDVMAEDNIHYDEGTKKKWDVIANGALVKLKPIIENAEIEKKESIMINVVRVGSGKKTQYSINEYKE